jgi:hypothetical protein
MHLPSHYVAIDDTAVRTVHTSAPFLHLSTLHALASSLHSSTFLNLCLLLCGARCAETPTQQRAQARLTRYERATRAVHAPAQHPQQTLPLTIPPWGPANNARAPSPLHHMRLPFGPPRLPPAWCSRPDTAHWERWQGGTQGASKQDGPSNPPKLAPRTGHPR